ncbi:PKD repeat-containing protein [Saccharicrinis carchari]|uniref:PKD repeat-containing protein n=1 Tax=Saccharicrinis carchari TaxID=1168039 RepID=A0A521ADV4_SACCC|nr:PKD domain-containing protein [Saccharicrinis carchari]SMO32992.1 PKD repeat-containing protein [Saccharicrinis carchari]
MSNYNSHTPNTITLNRRVIRLVFFVVLFLGIANLGVSQTIYTCGKGSLTGLEVLAQAQDVVGNSMPAGHANSGSWNAPGITINDNGTNDATDDVVNTPPSAGSPYTLTWTHSGGAVYTVQLIVTSAVTINSFVADTPAPCGANYNAQVTIDITGGSSPYNYEISRVPDPNYSGTKGAGLTSINFGLQTTDRTYSLINLTDANGCEPSGLPMDAAFTLSSPPNALNVAGANDCTPNSLNLSLASPEAGVTYYLHEATTGRIAGSECSAAPYTWSPSAAGSYTIYAENTCGGADVLMLGGPFELTSPPSSYAVSIVEAAPHCAGNSYTVRLEGTETGVTYTLRNPLNNPIATLVGDGNLRSFATRVLATSGNYSVTASRGGCVSNMINTVSIGALPSIHNLTGGSVCQGNSLTVSLASSTAGVNYTLTYDDGTSVSDIETITPPTTTFNPVTGVGDYYVVAQAANGCRADMNGIARVNELPTALQLNVQGNDCPAGEVSIGTVANPTEGPATTYVLMRDGADLFSLSGNNGVLNFGEQTTAGKYTVRAERGLCSQVMTGSLQIYEEPNVLIFSANKTKYCASEPLSGVDLTVTNVDGPGIEYQLQRQNGAAWDNVGGVRIGGVGTNIVWSNQTAGVYRVMASNIGGCNLEMSNRLTIDVTPLPTASIAAQLPVRRCANVAGTFTLNVTLTGNAPFNFDIVDDKGNNIVNVVNSNLSTYTLNVNPADAQTTYSVINLTDAASCSPVAGTNTATVYVDPVPTITFSPANPEVCIGSPITIQANGAGGGTYFWSDGLGNNQNINISPSATDTYTVTATTPQGCFDSAPITVVVNPLPVLTFDTPGSKYEYCENDGLVSLTGNQAGATFSGQGVAVGGGIFDPDPASLDANIPFKAVIGVNPITYQYTDTKGCFNRITKDIIVNSVPVVSINGLATTYCADAGVVNFNGFPDGSAPGSNGRFEVLGSPSGEGVWWDEGTPAGAGSIDVGAALTNIGPKTITVRYTYSDPNTCAAFVDQQVTLLPDLNTNLSINGLPATLCETAAPVTLTPYLNGSSLLPLPAGASVTFTGPGASITNNADGTATFSPTLAGAGNHTITMDYTDAAGCSGAATATIQIGTPLDVPGLATEYCSSDNGPYLLLGSINGAPAVPNDGTTFTVLAPDGTTVVPDAPNGTYNFIPSVLFGTPGYGPGTYRVIYRYEDTSGGGCINTLTTEVEIIEELNPDFTIGGDPYATAQSNYCIDDAAATLLGSIDLRTPANGGKAVGNVFTSFTGNGVSGNGISGGFFNPGHSSVDHNNPNTITHTVIHTVNGKSCPSPIKTFNVSVPLVDVGISNLSATGTYCANEGTSVLNVNGTDASDGKAVFYATKGGSPTPFLEDNKDNTATINPGIGAGVYEITMVFTQTPAKGGCAKTVIETVEVLADNPVTFAGVTENQNICLSSSTITLRGDMPSGGIGNFTITPNIAGAISNVGTDDLGNPVVVDDGVAILDPATLAIGPYNIRYEYVNAAGCSTFKEKTIHIVGAPTDIFDITVKDKNGNDFGAYCIDDAPASKGVYLGLKGSSSGVTYELLRGGVSISPTKVEYVGDGLPFFFEDASGNEILFTQEGFYTVSASQVSCDGMMNGSVLVEQYELVLQEVSKKHITCIGANDGEVNLKTNGGSGSYEYSINAGASWQASPKFTGLASGNHVFSVRDLSSAACEKINVLTVKIDEPSAIVITEDVALRKNVGCVPCTAGVDCEGSARIAITGGTADFATYPGVGYDISWSTGGTDFTEIMMPAGNHSVTVTDGNGCVQSINVTIDANPALTLSEDLTLHLNNVCNGGNTGSYVVTASGGSGAYQFALTDPATPPTTWQESNYGAAGDQYQVNNLVANTYTLWVRDRNPNYQRCYTQVDVPIVITEPAALTLVEEAQTGITCNGASDGSFIVRASGGSSATYEFTQTDPALGGSVWLPANDGTDGFIVSGIGAGTYTVWMQDATNPICAYTSVSVTLNDVAALSYLLDEHTHVKCKGNATGRLEVTAQGGSGSYVYQWEDALGTVISTDKFAENLVAGDYYLTITDVLPTSCAPLTHTFIITEPLDALGVNMVAIKDNDCNATSNGSITVDVIGGTAPYTITWSNGVVNTEILSGLKPGNYSLNVTDANGCAYTNASTPYVVDELNAITLVTASDILVHNLCFGDNNGSIELQVAGGSGEYEFRLQGTEIRDWVNPVPANSDTYRFSNLIAGTYEVLVRDASNTSCEYSLGSYTITQPGQLTLASDPVTGKGDVTCYGDNDGFITISASGGSGDYDYSVNNGLSWTDIAQINTHTFSNLFKGTYQIKVRDFNNPTCVSATTLLIDVNQPDQVKATVVGKTNASCFTGNDGTVTLAAQGGSGNYDYYCVEENIWQNNNVFTLPKGTYTFQVQDKTVPGCISSPTPSVTVGSPLDFITAVPVVKNITCNGAADGSITFNTTFTNGSAGLFEYSIDNGLTYAVSPLIGLAAGTYTVMVRDGNNPACEKTLPATVTITEPAALSYTLDKLTDVQCKGESNGEIEISISGGTAPYTYQWSGISDAKGGKTAMPTGLSKGNYSVSITDNNGCAILPLPSFTVDEPAEIVADYTATHIAIGGQSTGSIVINNITGGPTTRYDVVWDDGSTNLSRTNLPEGNYYFTVNVRDAANNILCSRRYDVSLIDQSAPLDFTLKGTDALCYGNNGKIEITVTSGNPDYQMSWRKAGVLIGSHTTSNINHVVNLPYGVYEVTVIDNVGANVTKTVTIDQPDDFTLNAYAIDDKICFGDLARIRVDITGDAWDNAAAPQGDAFTVSWIDPDGLMIANGLYSAEATQDNLSKSGNYTVNVFHNANASCVKSAVVTVSNPQPLGITSTVKDVTCFGGSDGQISVVATGRPAGHGFSYTWEVDYGSGWTVLGGETGATIKDKTAALYRVTVQSTSTVCSYTSAAIQIQQPDKVQANVTHADIITCNGDDSGVIQLTNINGGTAPYRYVLNGGELALPAGVSNYTIDKLVSQNYTLRLKDVNGCESDVYSVNIDEPEELKLNINTGTIDCETVNSGEITLTVQGGRMDASGNQRYLVTASPDGKADIVLPIIINNTGVAMSVNSPLLQNLPANRYVISVKDLNSNAINKCYVSEVVILEHIKATADINEATCFGVNNGSIQNVQITGASSNITYSWSSPDGGTGIDNANLDQTGLSNGTYRLSIVDVDRGGCSVSFDFVVDYKNTITINGTVSDVICNGQSSGAIIIKPEGIGVGTSYNWSGPAGYTFTDNTTANQSNLPQGSYTLAIETTLDGEQCLASQSFTVNEPAAITYNAYFEYTDCDPYQRTLKVENVVGGTGEYNYTWNGPAFNPVVPANPTEVLIEKGGTYTITVKDKNLCAVSKDVFVPGELSIVSNISHIKCNNGNNGAIDITDVLGGSGAYSFAWTGPAGFVSTLRNIDNLRAGTYDLRITDLNENVGGVNCYRDYTFVVTEPQAIAISPTVVNVSCYGRNDGQIEIGVLGGTAPYKYNWSPVVGTNAANAKNQYNLPADDYTLTVTDANNCVTSLTISVVQDPEIQLSATVVDTQCDGTNGQIDLTVTGGSGVVADYKYNWSSLLGTGLSNTAEDQTGLTGGVYTVVFTDTHNGRSCSEELSVVLTHPIKVINTAITPVNCSGNDNGAITFDVTGGDGNYSYLWSVVPGSGGNPLRLDINGKNQSGLSEGKYQVVITDGRTDPAGTDCAITEIFEVKASTGLVVAVSEFESNMCYGEPTGRLEASVSGGSGNYEYKWDGIVGTSIHDNLTQGVYQLEVTDLNLHCKFIQSYEINGPDAPITATIDITDVLCHGEATGEINVSVLGGTVAMGGDYTYQWSGPSTAVGSNPGNLLAGIYDLKIIDDEACELDVSNIEIKQPVSHVNLTNPVITNVTTVGGSDGSISVDVTGGIAPYTYQWYNGSNNPIGVNDRVQPNLSADTYRVVVTDNNGCTFELTGLTVVQPGAALGFNRKVYHVSPCNGDANGEIHITSVYGGFPISGSNYRIQINGPGVNVDQNNTSWVEKNLVPGDYTIVISDDAAVQVTETISITEPVPLNIVTAKVADVACFEAKTGQIDVTVSGGTPDAAGNYRVLLESPEKGLVATKLDAEENVMFSFTNLPAGNYTITAYDHANDFDDRISVPCSVTDVKLITQPAAELSLSSVSGDTDICNGESYALTINTSNWDFTSQGNLNVSVYDGFATTEYSVDRTPFPITVTPSSTRTYQITRVNTTGGTLCLQGRTDGSKVSVNVNTLPTASISGPGEVCQDGTVQLTAVLTGVKPFTITWQDALNGTSDTEIIDAYTYTFTDAPVNNARYSILSVRDNNGCSNVGNGQVDVMVNDKPQVSLTGSSDICIGSSTTLQIGLLKGVQPFTITYKAYKGTDVVGTEGTLVINTAGAVYNWLVSPLETTVYEIISVQDAKACEIALSPTLKAKVTINPLPKDIIGITSNADVDGVCQGLTNIDYSVDAVDNATNYTWTVETGMHIVTGNGTTDISVNVDSTFTGGYVRVQAENACGASAIAEKWVNAKPLPDNITVAPSGPTDICEGESGLIYSIPPALNASSYEWDIPAGLMVVGDATGTSILVDIDPNVPFTIGKISVRPINGCGTNKHWSPALTIKITPLPVVNAGPDERICRTTYTLAAGALQAGETGRWTITNGAAQYENIGVDQIQPNARVKNLSQGANTFVWTVTNTTTGCSSSDEVTIYNDQVTVNAVADQYEVCDGTVELNATPLSSVDAPGGTGLWSTPDGAVLTPANAASTTATNMARGENTFIWTIQKGACQSTATVKVINNQPTEAIIYDASDVIIAQQDLPCGDDFTRLKGSVPVVGEETGYWTIESGSVSIDNINSPDIQVTNIPAGDHILSWNILNGSCLSTTTVKIRNNSFIVDAGKDNFTCDGSILLNATDTLGGAQGRWTVIEGKGEFDDAEAASTWVRNLDQQNNGRNVFRWTLRRNGCESSDEVLVINNQPGEAQIEGDKDEVTVCDSEYTLNAVDPVYGHGIWTVVSGKGEFDNPTQHNTTVSGIVNGENIFRWTVYNQTCSSSVEFSVTNLHVNTYAGRDTAVCGTVATLNATPAPPGASGTWSVVDGMGSGSFRPTVDYPVGSENPNANVESLSSGNNQLVWKVTNEGCITTDTVVVSNNQPTPVSAQPKASTSGDYIDLSAEVPNTGTGLWTLLEGRGTIISPTSPSTRIENLFPNINRFRWTVTNLNCSEYVDVEVQSGALADAEAGLNQLDLCEDFTTLNANLPENTFGEWTVEQGSVKFENSEHNNPKVKIYNIKPGRNVLKWTLKFVGSGTQSKSDTVVIINNKPSDADAGYDITECGTTAQLNAKAPIIGKPLWTVLSGGGIFNDATIAKPIITELAPGENVIKYEINNEMCYSYDTIRVYNMEPSEAIAGENQIVCADSTEIKPTLPKYGNGTWRVIEGAGKGKDSNGNYTDRIEGNYVYSLAPGKNVLVWEVQVPGAAANCIKRDTITIINNQPSLSYAGQDRSICTDTVSLSGSVPIYGTGTWTLISGSGEIADSSLTNTLVSKLGKGKNRFRWTVDNNGCLSISEVEISNNFIESMAGHLQINCADTAALQANNPAPGVGSWGIKGGSGSAQFDDNADPYTNVRNLDKGENILTWTIDHKGCPSVSEVKIINNAPSKADAGDNKATCENTFVLGASSPEVGTGVWSIRSGGGKFVNHLNASTRVDSLKFGDNIFRWTVEHKGCFDSDDVQISFNKIDAEIRGDQEVCSDRAFLEANSALPGVGTWTVVGGGSQAKFVDSHDPLTEVYDLARGKNRLKWTVNNKGCITSKEVVMINHMPSTAYAGNTQEHCKESTVLDATPVSIGTGKWEILTGSAIIPASEINNPKAPISGLSKGENVLRWIVTSDNGLCDSKDDVRIINNLPSEPYAGASDEYCSPTVVLKATAPDFGTGRWSIVEGGGDFNDPALPNATIANLQEGKNVLRWTVSQGQCFLFSDIEVINNTPPTANAGPDIDDCKDYATLDANIAPPGTGYWTLTSGNADFKDENDAKTLVSNLTFGANILRWNIEKGKCISSDEIVVNNNIPDQAKAGTERETCEDYLTLNANDPTTGTGTWYVLSGNGDFDDPHSPISIVRNLGLGENKFKWVVSYGSCSTEDEVEIISNKAAPYAGEDDVSYASSYELKASNPGDLGATWTVVAGEGSFEDDTYYNTRVNGLKEGVNTFRWLMDINGCVTFDDVSIEYKLVPDAAFKVDTFQGCYPLKVQFTNQSIGGSVYSWNFGDGRTSNERNPVHTFREPGEYTVTLTAPGPDNVDGTYQMQILVHDHPTADFTYGPDVVYVPGDVLRVYSKSVDADKYLWDFGDGNTSTQVNPAYEYKETGFYTLSLQVTSSNNCVDQIAKVNAVEVKAEGFVVFPNSFMPRPDGGTSSTVGGGESNTVFRPVYKDVDTYKLQIFNRWGQLIYEGEDIDEGWNGFFNSQLSPQAVYVWKATGTFISGKTFNEAGSVLLVR